MSTPRQLPHTWALLERAAKPTLEQLTSALLTDWAADPGAVDFDLILAQLRATTKAGEAPKPGRSGPDFAKQLGHLVWWEHAKLASTHLGLQPGPRRTALGTAFELGVLLISTTADHPHLQEASMTDMHEAWVRFVAGDDPSRAANLREQLVVLAVVEGKGSLAPDLYVIARRQPGDNLESPPPIGVIPVRLHHALEQAKKGEVRRDVGLTRALQPLAGLVSQHGDPRWRENFTPYDRKRNIDRFRTELRGALETTMTLLEQTSGQQALDDLALGELREAASILVFRVFFVVTLERRGLFYEKPLRPGEGLRGLIAAGDEASDSPFLFLQDLTAAIRETKSATGRRKRQLGVVVKHASIFRNRPTDDFSDGLEAWLDAIDAATPKLAKDPKRLREWDVLLARLEPLALNQIRRYEFEAQDAEPVAGGTAHVQRILGDVYEQILAMVPTRSGSGKTSRVQLTVDGKARASKDVEPTDKKSAKALEKTVSSERKALGAHYTPEDLVTEVVLAALEPAFAGAWARADKKVARYRDELLGLRVLDPAMGSAHFLTVAAQEIARELAWSEYKGRPRESKWFEVWPEEWTPDYKHEPDPWTRVDAADREALDRIAAKHLQDVVQACCHGVDVKPLAVELGKLALWMLTMVERQARGVAQDSEPPLLTFVDKNLRCGDSLRGVDEKAVESFFADVYGVAKRNQTLLFGTDVESLDDVLRCMFRLHEVLSKPADVVAHEAEHLLITAGEQLGRTIEPVSEDPQDLRVQLHEVSRELNWILRWTWDLAFLFDWYGRREDALWEALTAEEGITAENWVGLLGGPGKVGKKHKVYRERVRAMAAELRAFHWPLEFYDVFHRAARGFDVIVANPPFLGDRDLRGKLGEDGVAYLRTKFVASGTPDLCGFFVLAIDRLLNNSGSAGVIGPNTLGQAKNRRVVLVPLVGGIPAKFKFFRACASRPWPGDAAVHVLTLHMSRTTQAHSVAARRISEFYEGDRLMGLICVHSEAISSYLDSGPESDLVAISGQDTPFAFQGMLPRGEFDRPLDFAAQVPVKEKGAIFAYLNNRDIQQQPEPDAQRVIIDVSEELTRARLEDAPPKEQEAWLKENLPTVYSELRNSVREDRIGLPDSARNKRSREYWWEFEELRPGLRSAWGGISEVVAIGRTGRHMKPVFVPKKYSKLGISICPTDKLYIVPTASRAIFAVFTFFGMEIQTRRLCSTLETRMNFAPSDVLPFFPFPWPTVPWREEQSRPAVLNVPDAIERRLTPPAQALLDLRKAILLHPDAHDLTRAQVGGPTDLYNLFDDPKCDVPAIEQLREAHHALELALLREYGWQDLHGPWTFDRPWLDGTWRYVPPATIRRNYLERLAELNHSRAGTI
ncbi:Eco57I restriction-modification methylase domain-containing protein [Nannocystaceae bacterium ST9]